MSKPNQAQVRCLCGRSVIVMIGGKNSSRCMCGIALRVRRNRNGQVTPWARIAEDSLSERKRAGKPVKHRQPKIVRWVWATKVGRRYYEVGSARA